MPLATDLKDLLKFLKEKQHIVIQINIVDSMEEKDKRSLIETLQSLIEETDYVKITVALDIDDDFEKDLLTEYHATNFDLLEIRYMDPKDAM